MHGQLGYAYEYVVCEYVSHMRGDGGTNHSPLGDSCCTMVVLWDFFCIY